MGEHGDRKVSPNPFRQGLDGPPGPPAVSREPLAALWLVYLFFRPRVFFGHFITGHLAALTAVCAWVYGVSGAIERLDRKLGTPAAQAYEDSWGVYWGIALGAGLVGGLIYYAIGGWWYRLRARWSGARDADPVLARRVYLYAAQIVAIPTLIVTIVESGAHASPGAAAAAPGSLWHLLLLVFPFWSVVNSYVGVRTVFGVRGWRPVLWFIALPSVWFALMMAAFAVNSLMGTLAPAQVSNPGQHSSAAWTFDYPRNWTIHETEPDAVIFVEAPQDAGVHLLRYEASGATPLEEIEASLAELSDTAEEWKELSRAEFGRWGRYEGHGLAVRFDTGGGEYIFRFFAVDLGDGTFLEVEEFCGVDSEQLVRPGFELISSSMEAR